MKTRRLRDRLDRRVVARRLQGRHLRSVARALFAFHAAGTVGGDGESVTSLAPRSRERGARLEASAHFGRELRDLLDAQQRFLTERIDGSSEPMHGERIRRLHGRLRCSRVWASGKRGVYFDDPEPGVVGDVAADLGDLALDLRARGAERCAERLVATYARVADDYGLYDLLDFYERESALRFALDAVARPAVGEPSADGYLRAARSGPRPRAAMIAIGGGVATGKSTLAKAAAKRLAAPRIVADRVRGALLEPIPDASAHELGWDAEFAARVYREMLRRAEPVLRSGRSLVLDACFSAAANRIEAAALADRYGARFVFVECAAPEAEVTARLQRRDARDGVPAGSWQVLARGIAAAWDPPGESEPGARIRVENAGERAAWLRSLRCDGETSA